MKETTPAAMPPCFDKWCKRFDNLLRTKAKRREFRHYIGGLLGESERKNLSQIARDAVEVTYHKLHHCLDAVAHGTKALAACDPQDRAASLLD